MGDFEFGSMAGVAAQKAVAPSRLVVASSDLLPFGNLAASL
jgi:hypothetical protein